MGKPHHQLDVWNRSISFVTKIYKMTTYFPSEEKFSLVSQMRRAAVSIPSNIAEGADRSSLKDFINFLRLSQGSVVELETQILICCNLEFVYKEQADPLLAELE